MLVKWDWYSTTVEGDDPEKIGLIDLLLKEWELSEWRMAPARNGYHYGGAIYRGDRRLCHLAWGGQPGISCTSTSGDAISLEKALRENGVTHRPTRVDACHDMDEKGKFDELSEFMLKFAEYHRIKIDQRGDWLRGKARTLYLGSEQSSVRICMYEKGYEQGGGASLDWVRFEVRVKPKQHAREKVASWRPAQVYQAGFVSTLCCCLGWFDLSKENVSTIWQPSDEEKVIRAMLRQYGKILKTMAENHSGQWDKVGLDIGERIKNLEESNV